MMLFYCIHISQGSVATCLQRGGIFKHEYVANSLPSRLVKKMENREKIVKLWPRVWCLVFLTHGVLKSNKKLYALYRMVTQPMTLSDP